MKRTLTDDEKNIFEYLLKIISATIKEKQSPVPYEGINYKILLKTAEICGFASLVSNALLEVGRKYDFPKELVAKLKSIQGQQLLIDGVLCYEVEKILRIFDKYKIKNAPLKGYFLKNEYPRSDFRSVSDFDILFDKSQTELVRKAFAELGYEYVQDDDTQCHFRKLPYTYIEMHSSLVHKDNKYYKYLQNQLDTAVKRNGYEYSYRLKDEDHYLYLLIHSSNHFCKGGMSIRMMLDIYLFYKHHKNNFDIEYIYKKLDLYGLKRFEKIVLQVCENWFENDCPVITFDDFETYIMLSCTLGRLDASIMIDSQNVEKLKKGERRSKLAYFMESIFPPIKAYKYRFTYINKYPFLLPVAWASHWIDRIFIRKDVNLKRGIKNRISYSNDDVDYFYSLLNEVGLNE